MYAPEQHLMLTSQWRGVFAVANMFMTAFIINAVINMLI